MQRAGNGQSVICGARRRALLEELRGVCAPVLLCAPAGYGKSVFAQLLHTSAPAVAVREERSLRATPLGEATIVCAEQLAFDDEEFSRVFSAVQLSARDLERIRALAGGWPIAVFYFLRLVRLGALERTLCDLADPAMDDLYDYIEQNVYAPATRTQRLALLLGESGLSSHPLVRAAIRRHHGHDSRAACIHRARTAMRKSAYSDAARWFLAAGQADDAAVALARAAAGEAEDRDAVAALPFSSLQPHPHLWLRACEERLAGVGAPAFASEAAAVVKAFEHEPESDEYALSSLWLAIAHALNGNTAAALAARDRAGAYAADVRLAAALAARPARTPEPSASASAGLGVRVELFRGIVTRGGEPIELAQREAAVLFLLAAAPQRAVDSQHLASTIWREADEHQRRAALKVAVARLRARLGDAALVRFTGGKYALHEDVEVDYAEVTRALDAFERGGHEDCIAGFQNVLNAYRPPRLRDAPWFASIESELVRCTHRLAQHLSRCAATRSDARVVHQIGSALLSADPCDEDGCILTIRAYLMEGRADAARAAFARFAARLRTELGCEPSFSLESIGGAAYA